MLREEEWSVGWSLGQDLGSISCFATDFLGDLGQATESLCKVCKMGVIVEVFKARRDN